MYITVSTLAMELMATTHVMQSSSNEWSTLGPDTTNLNKQKKIHMCFKS